MLAHQLPTLPPFEKFWEEIPAILDWLHGGIPAKAHTPIPITAEIDPTWRPPAMAQPWHASVPLEIIRFAASNRLCIDLEYQRTWRLIEPYSLRRTRDGNLLLMAVKHETGESRSYRIDRIQGAKATSVSFVPKYLIELTPSGSMSAPPLTRQSRGFNTSERRFPKSVNSRLLSRKPRSGFLGPIYVLQCSYCGKKFSRKEYGTNLNPHKDKHGYPCPGRVGYLIDTKY